MTWRDVFDGNNKYYGSREEVAKVVEQTGYKFFTFNDDICFFSHSEKTWYDTSLKVSKELDGYSERTKKVLERIDLTLDKKENKD